ncbi:MAG: hypothetical protein IT460_14145 [Planctomycetes bacterium]|nr:hypothetical protein [Planctomycetota bacterium]
MRDDGGGTEGDDGVGGATSRRRIAPRHRDAVRAFFEPEPTPAPPAPAPAPPAMDGGR